MARRDTLLQQLAELARTQRATTDLVTRTAAKAREAGASWGQIGGALGVSRQAARKRFGGRDGA